MNLFRQAAVLFFTIALFLSGQASARGDSLSILSDEELAGIEARGFYFRMDLSLEVFTDGSTAPQVVLNTGQPTAVETGGSTGTAPSGSISLSDNAQSNMSSLINIIGAASVINVGVNIINIQNSSYDTIYTTNINTGAQGSNFGITLSLLP
ncbi:MAG TPA: hypothetical protein VI702_02975 [Nitrospiria bacterium]